MIIKIGWTSNNQKNLTDLSDLALEIGESNKKNLTEKPKGTHIMKQRQTTG